MSGADMLRESGYRPLPPGERCKCIKIATDAEGGLWCCGGQAAPAAKVIDDFVQGLLVLGVRSQGSRVTLPRVEWERLRDGIKLTLPDVDRYPYPGRAPGAFMYHGITFAIAKDEPKADPIGQWKAEMDRARAHLSPLNPAREALMWTDWGLERSADGDVAAAPIPNVRVEYCREWSPKNCARYPFGASSLIAVLEAKLAAIEALLNPAKQEQDQQNDKDHANNT